MGDRVVAWVSAGVLATGMSVGMLAGAGLANADDSGADSATSSQSSAARGKNSPDVEKPSKRGYSGPRRAARPTALREADQTVRDGDDRVRTRERFDSATDESDDNEPPSLEARTESVSGRDSAEATGTLATDNAAVADPRTHHREQARTARRETTAEPATGPTAVRIPTTTRFAMTADLTEPTPRPTLLNVVGSFFWGLFDLATRLVDLPPTVPPGSTVTAGRSRLEIDCGDGYRADADWYFPTDDQPEKFIYFQHGFPARAGFYNVTLRELAERNNAIVVAPSITSNIFACDACAASGEPMQVAVAQLFGGDRAALLASARAAGYDGTLPEQFVFSGQSAGASLAVAAARYYSKFSSVEEKSDMAGVLLYEVSALGAARTGGALANALADLPDDLPVLNIAAEPNTLNSQGSADAVFNEKRPGQFNGIQLVGGAHSDAFRSSTLFGIPQLIVSLFFGASKAHNVEAVHVLTEGWLTDMYERRVYNAQTRTGIYGDPGEPGTVVIDIPTDRGMARGYVLPARTPTPSPFDRLINVFFGLINVNYFARCAEFPGEFAPARGC